MRFSVTTDSRKPSTASVRLWLLNLPETSRFHSRILPHFARELCRFRPIPHFAEESWLPDMDLNHDKQIQSLLCYRYTIGQAGAAKTVSLSPGESRCVKRLNCFTVRRAASRSTSDSAF